MSLHWIINKRSQLFIALVVGSLIRCESDTQKGERLAKTYCGSCHAFTQPELLDKTTWEKSILPEMAFRMGLPSPVISKKNFNDLQDALPTIPREPMVTEDDYRLITKYFLSLAPDSLAASESIEPASMRQFEVNQISLSENLPMVTLLKLIRMEIFSLGTEINPFGSCKVIFWSKKIFFGQPSLLFIIPWKENNLS